MSFDTLFRLRGPALPFVPFDDRPSTIDCHIQIPLGYNHPDSYLRKNNVTSKRSDVDLRESVDKVRENRGAGVET